MLLLLEALARLVDLGLLVWNRWEMPRCWQEDNLPLHKLQEYVDAKLHAGEKPGEVSGVVHEYEFGITLKGQSVYRAELRVRGEDPFVELRKLSRLEYGILQYCRSDPRGLLDILSSVTPETKRDGFFPFFRRHRQTTVRDVLQALHRLVVFFLLTYRKRGDDRPRRAEETLSGLEEYVELKGLKEASLSEIPKFDDDYAFELTQDGLLFLQKTEPP